MNKKLLRALRNKRTLAILGLAVGVIGLIILIVTFPSFGEVVISQIICAGGLAVFILVMVMILARTTPNPSTFGSAHFAGQTALQDAGLLASTSSRDPGLVLGQVGRQLVAVPERLQLEHMVLIAPTGMGKTSGVIIPGLLTEQGKRGLFINDVKGELYEKCAGYLSGFMPVALFSPLRPAESVNYNPLVHVASMEDAEDFAISWVDNTGVSDEPYWNETAKLLITAVVLHLRDVEPQAPLSRLADILSSSSVDQIRQLLTSSKSDLARDVGKSFINNIAADAKLAGSILSGMATRFMTLKNPMIRRLTAIHPDAARNIDFMRLARDPGALFLSIAPQDSRRLRPLVACLIMQLMASLTRRGLGASTFALYLDELANAGKIPHYAEHISLVRGQGLALIQAIQDFGQLRRVYGDDDAATILANSTTKVFYPGCGKEETEYASAVVGAATVQVDSETRQGLLGLRANTTQSWAQRPLMTPDEIRRMQLGELLVISKNIAPVVVWNTPYFRWPILAQRAILPAPGTIAQLPPRQLPPQIMGP